MNIYSVEETEVGNYFKINYLLARQLMTIYDIFKQRILDATVEDIQESITERTVQIENNKVKYYYDDMPKGWEYFVGQHERPEGYKDFINWFFRNRQQPVDYLIYGVIKHKEEKRSPMQDNTNMSAEYGGIPIDIEDASGKVQTSFAKKF